MLEKELLTKVWRRLIKEYQTGCICSERHLQAEFYSLLKRELADFKNNDYKIGVEPRLTGDEEFDCALNGKIPDLLITQHNTIVAMVELKYSPYNYVIYEFDVLKLNTQNIKGQVYLKTDPQTGDWNKIKTDTENHTYSFDANCLKVFGFITRAGADASDYKYEKDWLILKYPD